VTDARAAMAIYRLHRNVWERGNKSFDWKAFKKTAKKWKKGNPDKHEGDEKSESIGIPVGGRKGVSSGLSTVVKRSGSSSEGADQWWKELGAGSSKGSMWL
jgi:RNA exonuclease 4